MSLLPRFVVPVSALLAAAGLSGCTVYSEPPRVSAGVAVRIGARAARSGRARHRG